MDVSKGKNYTTIKAGRDLGVSQAADLLDALVKTVGHEEDVRVDLRDVVSADLSCLQILCSAHKTAKARGINMTIQLSREMQDIALRAGLMYQISPSDSDYKSLWNFKG